MSRRGMWVLCLHESHAEEQQRSVHRGNLCVDTVRGVCVHMGVGGYVCIHGIRHVSVIAEAAGESTQHQEPC